MARTVLDNVGHDCQLDHASGDAETRAPHLEGLHHALPRA